MLHQEKANQIGTRWIEDWNNLSVEQYMDIYSDNVVLVSSLAFRLFPDSHGRLQDKKLLKEYWELVRIKFPQFKFKVSNIHFFENKIVVNYETIVEHTKAIAILTIDGFDKICQVEVSYV